MNKHNRDGDLTQDIHVPKERQWCSIGTCTFSQWKAEPRGELSILSNAISKVKQEVQTALSNVNARDVRNQALMSTRILSFVLILGKMLNDWKHFRFTIWTYSNYMLYEIVPLMQYYKMKHSMYEKIPHYSFTSLQWNKELSTEYLIIMLITCSIDSHPR